jgi:hypothetical protein
LGAEKMSYPGGKNGSGVFQTIINMIPPHDVYIESHLGHGAIMRKKRPAVRNIGIDSDPMVIATWKRSMQACTVENGSGCPGGHHQNDGDRPASIVDNGVTVQQTVNNDSRPPSAVHNLQKAVDSALLPSFENNHPPLCTIDIGEVAGRNLELVNADAVSWLAYFFANLDDTAGKEIFIYHDPPYLMDTRSTQRELYTHEYTVADHRELLELIVTLPCNQAISGYYSEMYMEMLASWNYITYQAMTRGGKLATEYLWFNYLVPDQLHDYRYLGDDYRRRERIKRKCQRWVERLKRMDELERWAILSAIEEVFDEWKS